MALSNEASPAPLQLTCADRLELLADTFAERGRVQVRNVLDLASANRIYESLAGQKQWNLVYRHNGDHVDSNATAIARWPAKKRNTLAKVIYAEARQGFQYYYANIPVYDLYHREELSDHFFGQLFEFLNGDGFLDTVRAITADSSIAFADAQVTRFDPGHFLTRHDDDVAGKRRRVAYVLSFAKDWQPDWGGALQFFDSMGNVEQAFTPTFNALSLFKVPMDHSVGIVSPFAGQPRYSITGWLRSGADPGM